MVDHFFEPDRFWSFFAPVSVKGENNMTKYKQTLVLDKKSPIRLKTGVKAGMRKAGEKPLE